MELLVFVTDDGSADGTGPLLFLTSKPDAVLPDNPRSMPWRYFATISEQDAMFVGEGSIAKSAIEVDGFYIADRLI